MLIVFRPEQSIKNIKNGADLASGAETVLPQPRTVKAELLFLLHNALQAYPVV